MGFKNADNWLKAAAKRGDIGDIRAALAEGAKGIDKALFQAAGEGHAQAAAYLATHCADNPKAISKALTGAANHGQPECLRVLLEAGADPRARDHEALVVAVDRRRLEEMALLLEAGADVGARHGYPLRWAAWSNGLDTIRLLVGRGADPNVRAPARRKDMLPSGPLECAIGGGAFRPGGGAEAVALLLELGADPAGLRRDEITHPWCWKPEVEALLREAAEKKA